MIKYKRKFCWIPRKAYISPYCIKGFVWLKFVYVTSDGKAYISFDALPIENSNKKND